MRHVGIFLFEPRDFGLHKLVEFGQLLPPARAACLSCTRCAPGTIRTPSSDGREGNEDALLPLAAVFLAASPEVCFPVVTTITRTAHKTDR